ncbi:hypothetical protein E4U32_001458 [Claviceps aff. humidiphila group G2b]|nr:hypothetical protein E4U32_001458 [Claviceps aff. humidiphila group G2b]
MSSEKIGAPKAAEGAPPQQVLFVSSKSTASKSTASKSTASKSTASKSGVENGVAFVKSRQLTLEI